MTTVSCSSIAQEACYSCWHTFTCLQRAVLLSMNTSSYYVKFADKDCAAVVDLVMFITAFKLMKNCMYESIETISVVATSVLAPDVPQFV